MEEVKRSTVSESVPINEALFDFQFSLLQQSLLLNYESFIYIDSSYQTDFINNIYKMYITMGRDMVAQICKLLNKKYKIIFLYDIVGYKFPNFTL